MRYFLDSSDRDLVKRVVIEVLGETRTNRTTRKKPRRLQSDPPLTLVYGRTANQQTAVGNTVDVTDANSSDVIPARYGRKATKPLKPLSDVWIAKARGDEDWHVLLWACGDEV